MQMLDVASYFDQEKVYDAYTKQFVFKGQLSEFKDVSSVGSTLRRRTLSVAPKYSVPARACVNVGGLAWIAGLPLNDSFQGTDVRKTYNLRKATDLFEVLTPAQACSATLGTTAYGYAEYLKDTVNQQTDSELGTFWDIYFAPDEATTQGKFLQVGTRLLRVRQSYVAPENLRVSQSDELDADWSQSAVFAASVYNPVTDAFTGPTVTSLVVQIEAVKFYRWRTWAEADLKPGDRTVLVPTTALTPKVGRTFNMLSKDWRIVSLQTELDAWAIHARPA
jgi:hypothetical protein